MSRPAKVYDPFHGGLDRKRSSREVVEQEDARKGQWVGGVFVVADKQYIETEDPGRVLGFTSHTLDGMTFGRNRHRLIRGERIA